MRLRLQTKLLLGLLAVLLLVSAAGGWFLLRYQKQEFAGDVAGDLERSRAFMEATRSYVKEVVRPALDKESHEFMADVESSTRVARGVFERYAKNYPDYRFKEAADNPLNLLNKADSFEEGILRRFRADRGLKQITTFLPDGHGSAWYVSATPIVVERSCLRCHDTPDAAPREILARYGREHGFGWEIGDVAAALTVRVPTAKLQAEQALFRKTVIVWVVALAAALMLVIWLCARQLVWLPMFRMSMHMYSIAENSAYHQKLPEASRSDELGASAKAFNHVLTVVERSMADLREANESLETRVAERTTEIASSNAQLAAIHATSLDCVIVMDQQGCITEFNPAAQRTFKCRREDVIGQNMIEMCMGPAEHQRQKENLRELIEHPSCHIGAKQSEVEAVRSDGGAFFAEMAVTIAILEGPPILIASLRDITARKQAEIEHEELTQQLLSTVRQAGMAEVATGVLHNVGNILNSVNVAANTVADKLRHTKAEGLGKAAALLQEHANDLQNFMTTDEKGKHLPNYLAKVAQYLAAEQQDTLGEITSLLENVEHIKNIVSLQQSYARVSGVMSSVTAVDLVEDALRFNQGGWNQQHVEIVRDFKDTPAVTTDKHKVLQILVNLLNNAKRAMDDAAASTRRVTVRVALSPDDPLRVCIQVVDTGIGIPPENLKRIFSHGFTTKKDGHGFGLHGSALAARELGGSLIAYSAGPGHGAAFTLELPVQPAEVKA
jgi:PAS domain S-box-containing protein